MGKVGRSKRTNLDDWDDVRDRAMARCQRPPDARRALRLTRDLDDCGDQARRRRRRHRARGAAGQGEQRGEDGRQTQAGHALTIALRLEAERTEKRGLHGVQTPRGLFSDRISPGFPKK